ncbi:hypothetical protein CXF68_01855 [Tenacibaculum sp. Bg11-29]|uniref:hypothetical protein n=1 Tax=Tenacibaculum sp. Bg11-29 TaxID=2058306 RepID=UPI000C344107|nr:hypothetical protein [Tenacibaculum sp. Bg11-29]PKH49507.1 hypothetical protein CXF68_01855 [Tenacibaculum sp. Bg11-29]
MKWKIIKEHKREYADTAYYLKAERDVTDGTLVLEISWVENFMYDLSVDLYTKNTGLKSIFKKISKNYIYGHLVFPSDRIEKYGHQLMRIIDDSPMKKLKRLDELQGDSVLNHNLSNKHDIEIKTLLPEKVYN